MKPKKHKKATICPQFAHRWNDWNVEPIIWNVEPLQWNVEPLQWNVEPLEW
jgi:hypothetical protein